MPSIKHAAIAAGAVGAALTVAPAAAPAAGPVDSAAGANAAAIQSTVDGFRARLGVLNPNNGVSFESGRREINWDGVPDGFSAPNAFPSDFFNENSPRGLVLSGAPAFTVSADAINPTATPVRFGDLHPDYPAQLITFSPQRLFAAPGSRSIEIGFRIPGTRTPASVASFASVFTDVDDAGASGMTLYDERGEQLADVAAPVQGGGLSFLGYTAPDGHRVARVRITTGTHGVALGLADAPPAQDVVALDDFIYGEPKAIPPAPEPPTVPAAPAESLPTVPATPAQPAAADRTAPRISRLRLRRSGRVVRYRLSEPAKVTFTLRRHGKRYRTVTRKGAKGRNTVRMRRLPSGRYRLRAIARDASGNVGASARRSVRIA